MLVALPAAAFVARMTEASMRDVLDADYIRTARAKGLAPKRVLNLHALPAAAPPIAALTGVNVSTMLINAAAIEYGFSLPGMFTTIRGAINVSDVAVLQAIVLEGVILVVIANFARRRGHRPARPARLGVIDARAARRSTSAAPTQRRAPQRVPLEPVLPPQPARQQPHRDLVHQLAQRHVLHGHRRLEHDVDRQLARGVRHHQVAAGVHVRHVALEPVDVRGHLVALRARTRGPPRGSRATAR